MAEILVRAKDNIHPDPDIDRESYYKSGHVVVVMPDGHSWGRMERLPEFFVIKIPTISVLSLKKYTDEHQVPSDIINTDGTRKPKTYQRRRWKIDMDKIPPPVLKKIFTDGEITIKASPTYSGEYDYTWNQMKRFFRNHETDEEETEDVNE